MVAWQDNDGSLAGELVSRAGKAARCPGGKSGEVSGREKRRGGRGGAGRKNIFLIKNKNHFFAKRQYFIENNVFLKSYGVLVVLPCTAPKFRVRWTKEQLRSSSGSRVMSK